MGKPVVGQPRPRSMKLWRRWRQAVADTQIEVSHEESAEAGSGASRPRTRQNGGTE